MAECVIGGDGVLRIGAAAGAGLRHLRRGGDEVGDKVRVGTAGRPHMGGGLAGCLIDFRQRNKGVAHGHLPVPKRDIAWSFPRISQAACRDPLPTLPRMRGRVGRGFSEFFRLQR
jgi:hypothetical protein